MDKLENNEGVAGLGQSVGTHKHQSMLAIGATAQLIAWACWGVVFLLPLGLLAGWFNNPQRGSGALILLPVMAVLFTAAAFTSAFAVSAFLQRRRVEKAQTIATIGTVLMLVPLVGLVSYFVAEVLMGKTKPPVA